MNKPFFVRLDVSALTAEYFNIPPGSHDAWLRNLIGDLNAGVGNTEFSKSLIDEAKEYSRRKSENGKKGGRPKNSKGQL